MASGARPTCGVWPGRVPLSPLPLRSNRRVRNPAAPRTLARSTQIRAWPMWWVFPSLTSTMVGPRWRAPVSVTMPKRSRSPSVTLYSTTGSPSGVAPTTPAPLWAGGSANVTGSPCSSATSQSVTRPTVSYGGSWRWESSRACWPVASCQSTSRPSSRRSRDRGRDAPGGTSTRVRAARAPSRVATSTPASSLAVSGSNRSPGASIASSSSLPAPLLRSRSIRCSRRNALPDTQGSQRTSASTPPRRAASWAAKSPPIRMPTRPMRGTPVAASSSTAAETLDSQASTRPGSVSSPAESPVPS